MNIKYYNTNSNNSTDETKSELSDWEDLEADNNEDNLLHLHNRSSGKCLRITNKAELRNNAKILFNNEDSFEFISPLPSVEKNMKVTNPCEIQYTKSSVVSEVNMKNSNCFIKCVMVHLLAMIKSLFDGLHIGILILYLLFQAFLNYIYIPLQWIYFRFKDNAESSFGYSVKIIIFVIIHIYSMFTRIRLWIFPKRKSRNKSTCSTKRFNTKTTYLNTNNNASIDECESDNKSLCIYAILLAATVVGFFGFCWFNPDSKVCSIDNLIKEIKLNSMAIFHDIYVLPGDDCMKAARCCKGVMEATFRWLTCLFTLPIRATLTAWPRRDDEIEESSEKVTDIKMSVDKVIQELSELKDRANRQEELLIKLKTRFTALDKLLDEKSRDIAVIEPLLKRLTEILDTLRKNITTAENQIKNVISVRQESDKINENMKITVRDSAAAVKASISKMQTELQGEQRKLQSKIESLELLVNEDGKMTMEFNDRWLYKVKADLDHAQLTQDDIRGRLTTLKDLPVKYRDLSDKLKIEIKAKLSDELDIHEQMTKRTDCLCTKGINKFKRDLEASKIDFNCFVEKLVDEQSKKIQSDLKKELTGTFYDKTVDIAKRAVEEAMASSMKENPSRNAIVKGAGFFVEIEKIDIAPVVCDNESAHLMNFTSFCQSTKESNELFARTDKCLTKDEIKTMVKMAVARYSADKIGIADFALESMGGSVIGSQSSSTYNGGLGLFAFLYMPLNKVTNSLRFLIQPNNQPGDCWPFAGSSGQAVIKLSHKIIMNAVSLEHLPASLSLDGRMSSAPKQFSILIMPENDQEKEELIDSFEYKENSSAIQTFFIRNPKPVKLVQLKILNNHGNKDFTCVYRFRVHGSLYERSDSEK